MADEAKQPEKQPDPEKPERKEKRTLFGTVKASVLERWPEAKPWHDYFSQIHSGIKKGYIVLFALVVLIGLSVWVTHHVVSKKYQAILTSTNTFWSNTNAFLLGELSGATKQIDDDEEQIINLKLDNNKLTTEKESDDGRIATLEAMPEIAFLAYSNASVSLQADLPRFDLWINNESLTNYSYVLTPTNSGVNVGALYYVYLNSNRDITIGIGHLAPDARSIKDISVSFMATLDSSNIVGGIGDLGWESQSIVGTPGLTSLEEVSLNVLSEETGFECTPIVISQKYNNLNPLGQCTFRALIGITAPGLNVQYFFVEFLITPNE
jgi:hypothetical protein